MAKESYLIFAYKSLYRHTTGHFSSSNYRTALCLDGVLFCASRAKIRTRYVRREEDRITSSNCCCHLPWPTICRWRTTGQQFRLNTAGSPAPRATNGCRSACSCGAGRGEAHSSRPRRFKTAHFSGGGKMQERALRNAPRYRWLVRTITHF